MIPIPRRSAKSSVSLAALLAERYVLHRALRPGSVEQLRVTVSLFAQFLGREGKAADLNREMVTAFLNWYSLRASPATVAAKRSKLLALWRFAVDERLLRDPPYRVRTVPVPRKEPQGWDEGELRAILAAIATLSGCFSCGVSRASFLRAFALAALDTGLRLSALCAVKRCDVRADRSFTARWQDAKTWTEQPKAFSDRAWSAIEALGDWPHCLPYGRTKAEQRTLRKWWKRVLVLAGLPASRGAGPQQLRRTAASFKERQQPGTARSFLGHRTPGLAERAYLVPRIVRPELVAPPTFNF